MLKGNKSEDVQIAFAWRHVSGIKWNSTSVWNHKKPCITRCIFVPLCSLYHSVPTRADKEGALMCDQCQDVNVQTTWEDTPFLWCKRMKISSHVTLAVNSRGHQQTENKTRKNCIILSTQIRAIFGCQIQMERLLKLVFNKALGVVVYSSMPFLPNQSQTST